MESIQTPLRPSTFDSAQEPFASSLVVVWTGEPTIVLISITHPLSAPLRPALAGVRTLLRHPLTLPAALPLHSALYLPNTTSASSSARFQTPKHQPSQPHKRDSPAHTSSAQKKKRKKKEAHPYKATRYGSRKAAKSVRQALFPFPLPHRGPITDCLGEREIM